jgi:hypothetical protein
MSDVTAIKTSLGVDTNTNIETFEVKDSETGKVIGYDQVGPATSEVDDLAAMISSVDPEVLKQALMAVLEQ